MERTEAEKTANRLALQVLELDRNTLLVHLRFLDRALSRLRPVPGAEALSTDGRYLYFNGRSVLTRYREEREQSVRDYLHVILHCVFRHMFVHTLVDRERWDLACDIAVENIISSLGLPALAAGREGEQRWLLAALEKEPGELTAERIYRYLADRDDPPERLAELRAPFLADDHALWYLPPGEKDTDGTPGSGRGDNPEAEAPESADEEAHTSGGERGEGGVHETEGVSDVNAQGRPGSGDNRREDGSARTDAPARKEEERFWQETAERMEQDIEFFSFRAGEAPGSLIQNLKAVNRERYDYGEFLRRFAVPGEILKLDDEEFDQIFYTYGLELYGDMPLVEPLEYKEVRRIRTFVIAIDTSGSVAGDLVQRFVQKTYNILLSTESFFSQVDIWIVQCDAAVQEAVRITTPEEFQEYLKTMELRGFGGTDFRPVFRLVDRLRRDGSLPEVQGLIYLTDGDGLYPERMPDYPAAFVFIDGAYYAPNVPPWAIKLILQREDL
ncbi:MAG: metallopeptidase [Oscillospiraceae bacterium]|nr:metallopeptidase [Oscillospiraceae bacterium]